MSGPHPAVAAARGAVAASLADLPPEALVLVACSGGPDSLALAAATAHVARRSARHALRDGGAVLRLRAGAVVVDHGLRAGSAEVASRAARRCRELGLDPVLVETVDVGTEPGAGGPEGAARSARYAALGRAARETGAAAVLLGHSLDDQAETVLLALARGAGGRALSGMAPVRGILRRPLLALRRSELRAACEAAGLEPDEDPTNAPDGPWRAADGSPLRRSAVRHGALPALSGAVGLDVAPALARTAHRLRADEDLLDGLADDLWRSCAARAADGAAGCANGGDGANSAHGADGHVRLDVAALRAAHPALRSRVLHRALVAVGARAGDLSHRHVAALEGLLARGGRGAADLPGARAWRETGAGADGRAGGRSDARGCGTLVVTSSAHEIGVLEMRTRGAVDGREGHGRGPREGAAERGADPHPPR